MLNLTHSKCRKLISTCFLILAIASQLTCEENDTFLKDMVSKCGNEYTSLTDEKLVLYANPSALKFFATTFFLLISGSLSGKAAYEIKFNSKNPNAANILLLGIGGTATIYLCKSLIEDIIIKKNKNVPFVSFDTKGIYFWGELQAVWPEIKEIWINTIENNGVESKRLSFYKSKKSLIFEIPGGQYLPIEFDDLVKICEYYWSKYYDKPQN